MRISDWSSDVCSSDLVNILTSLLAKRYGCRRAVTLINKATYGPLIANLGIDTVVSPRAITVSKILQHVRRGRIRSVYSLSEDFGEVIEAEALETSSLVGVPIREARLPDGVIVGRSEEHTSELQSLMRRSSAGFCLK